MFKRLLLWLARRLWMSRARLGFSLYGPYGVSNVLKNAPYPFIQPILRQWGAAIGKNVRIDTGIMIHRPDPTIPFKNLIVHDEVYIGHNLLVDLSDVVEIGRNVAIGAGCQIWTHTGNFKAGLNDRSDYADATAPVRIEENVIIYSASLLSHGTRVCSRCRVGAGSVITKDLKEPGFYAGNPARFIKRI